MKFTPIEPPRKFNVAGGGLKLTLSDCARIDLRPDEQVTFTTDAGGEYDVARKDWGFYATPSTNGRLSRFDLRAALVLSAFDKLFVVLVEKGKEDAFMEYIVADKQKVLCWLDDDKEVKALAAHYGVE